MEEFPSSPNWTSTGRDGKSPTTALLSLGVEQNPTAEFVYVVRYIGQYLLTVASEAKQYHALGFSVYNTHPFISNNVDDMSRVTEWNDPVPAPAGEAFAGQLDEVYKVRHGEIDSDTDGGANFVFHSAAPEVNNDFDDNSVDSDNNGVDTNNNAVDANDDSADATNTTGSGNFSNEGVAN